MVWGLYLCLAGMLQAQPLQRPTLSALRLTSSLELDGHVEEAVWQQASVAAEFWQREPHDGQPATERTEVRVLYDDAALYVAFVCYDREPDRILQRLARRDRIVAADWVGVLIDSYHDRKTAFAFLVNAAGTKADLLILNDGNGEDLNWDAFWEARVALRPDDWSAEFRIPFIALRFSPSDTLRWGINFARIIGRKNEQVFWAYVPRSSGGFVSYFGTLLEGLEGIRSTRALLLIPYAVISGTHWSTDRVPRALHRVQATSRIGGDMQYHLSNNAILNLTINPDFGQVELDEVVLNLVLQRWFA